MATNYRSWEHVHRPLSYILRSVKFTGTLLTSKQQSPKKLTYLAVSAESGRRTGCSSTSRDCVHKGESLGRSLPRDQRVREAGGVPHPKLGVATRTQAAQTT